MNDLSVEARLAMNEKLSLMGRQVREVAYCMDILWYAAESEDPDMRRSIPLFVSQQCRILMQVYEALSEINQALNPVTELEKLYQEPEASPEVAD